MKIDDFNDKTLSVVNPGYNEGDVLPECHRRLSTVLSNLICGAEMVYVNDGKTDPALRIINGFRWRDDRVALVDLNRNFGIETEMTAGLDHAKGDAVVVADLKDPPELIPDLLTQYYDNYDVVYAQRTSRPGEGALKKMTDCMFYRLIQTATRVGIPADTGDFRLLSRRAVEALKKHRDQDHFMKGLYAWIGFPQKAFPFPEIHAKRVD